MPLPSAVQKKAEIANSLIADAGKPPPAAATPATPAATPAQPAPTVESAAELKAKLEQATKDLATANSRYAVLKGKFDNENPQLKQQVKDLEKQKADLEAKIAQKYESGELTGLSDEDRRLAGEDLVKVIAKAAREVAASEFDARIKPFSENVTTLQRQSEANYYATLDSQVPDWELQNEDPNFIAWLNAVDPASGSLRFDLLKRAEQGRQGFRVADIFKAFREKREIGAQAPSVQASQPPLDPPAGGEGEVPNLEGGQKKIWLQSEIRGFYNDKRRGLYAGKDDEARAIEADILAAGREGRVRSG